MPAPRPEQRRKSKPAVSVKARAAFLEALAAGWSVTHAAERAGVARQRLYERRDADERFAAEWRVAEQQGTDALEDEARRRAVDGWEEPVYQRGELVGHVRKYDSRLLEFLLRARGPGSLPRLCRAEGGWRGDLRARLPARARAQAGRTTAGRDRTRAERSRGADRAAERGRGRRLAVSGTTVLAGFEPTARQLDAARACLDPAARVVVLDGAIRSGKTQAAARIMLEWAVEQPATYLVARASYRSLKDSTEKALLFGDGGLPPLIPPELVDRYRASDELVKLRSGGEILFRSLEEAQVSKILNLSLAGILVDQIEELDPGDPGERVFDTLLGRLSDPRGPRKLLAVANPAGLACWQFRRLIDERTRGQGVRRVHFTLADNLANLPGDFVASMEATRLSRPTWHASFVEGRWGVFEGQAFAEFSEQVHVVEPFPVPGHWERFESMDHGAASPTAWHAWAVDEDGNLLVIGEHYQANMLVSEHAQTVLALRKCWHPPGTDPPVWADPSTGATLGLAKLGEPASVRTEYADHGIGLAGANNDRAAGYTRLLELIHLEPGRVAPPWASVPPSVGGSPRLYLFRSCRQLVRQFQSAPVAVEGIGAGVTVDPKWESAHGHAVASARYGAMSRPSPSEEPPPPLEDERAEALRRSFEAEREQDAELEWEQNWG
jgi:hypothetical protein